MKCEGAWSAYTVFEHLKDGTYYVAETDEDGIKLEASEVCKIEGNGTKCQITPTQKTVYAVIENQLLIPEYDKYLKEDDGDDTDGNDGKEKKKTSTSKNNPSNKTTKKGKNSKTGDDSHIFFYAALAAAALAAGSAEVYRRRRRATGRNKHDR